MDKITEKLNKLSLSATILIASIILGGFFYVSQVSKQHSIEKQQQIKIEQEKQDQLATKELKEKQKIRQVLNTCIANAEKSDSYQSFDEVDLDECAKTNNISRDEMFDAYTDFIWEQL